MAGPTSSAKSTRTPLSNDKSPPASHGSKLPKFLQKPNRDRSKSMGDQLTPSGSTTSSIASSSSASSINPTADTSAGSPAARSDSKRSSKLKGVKEMKDDKMYDSSTDYANESVDDPPIIIEPVNVPVRSRTRSERPLSASASDSHPSISYYSPSSSQRLTDLPTRLSGWFSQAFSTSSTDLSLPALLSQAQIASSSPKSKQSGLLTAAKHGSEHLSKAMRYLLDSDATPDKCTEPIWLLGIQHPGYEPPPPSQSPVSSAGGRRGSTELRRSTTSFRSSTSSRYVDSDAESSSSLSQSQSGKNPAAHWPAAFYSDFTSRIWLTYRSHYPPIRDESLNALAQDPSPTQQSQSLPARRWHWPGGGEKGWTSDSGWGCMLRTGQSLLANTLIHLHLGRDWRRPIQSTPTADYATYVKIVTWFLDTPDPASPFSVHRMALAGKELGKDVGQWFGPSTAAGAIKTLVAAFPEAGLGVAAATDGVLYETDVLAASNTSPYNRRISRIGSPRRIQSAYGWGQRPVLILVGIRLGIDRVNPVYYNSIQELYKFPQSVGIAGGRPSSSYYFVGTQGDGLFYLDPHHVRPAIPFRPPPRQRGVGADSPPPDIPERHSIDSPSDREHTSKKKNQGGHIRAPTSPPSSFHGGLASPSIQKQMSSQSLTSTSRTSPSPSHSPNFSQVSIIDSPSWRGESAENLDALQEHYVTAYPVAELRTYHCERVRKLPLSGLDPSMLLGFLCRDENDWKDLRERLTKLGKEYKLVFSIQDEPPSWPSDTDEMGLESVSDVDIDIDMDEPSDGVSSDRAKDDPNRRSEDVGTDDDPAYPVTPGGGRAHSSSRSRDGAFSPVDDAEDSEWVDPGRPTSAAAFQQGNGMAMVPPATGKYGYASSGGAPGKTAYQQQQGTIAFPSVRTPTPPQQQEYYPFPVVDDREDDDRGGVGEGDERYMPRRQRQRMESMAFVGVGGPAGAGGIPRLRNQKAKDGGRTQSGGVKGIVTSDLDDETDF